METFNFDNWCSDLKLSRKVSQTLRQEDLNTREALALVQEVDLKQIGLTVGAIKVIMTDIQKNNVADKSAKQCPTQELLGDGPSGEEDCVWDNALKDAGKTFDRLLSNEKVPARDQDSGPYLDPRTILTMKAKTKKAIHITDFITEKAKRRRQNKRREYILRSGQDNEETIVLKTDEDHPYLGIYIEEWGAANMRVLNHLLSTGQLKRQDIEYYLAYTTKIFEFAETHEWNSVLQFDFTYREMQAEHGFKWGTFSPHMEMQILVPKRPRHQHQSPASVNSRQAKEDCRIFKAKGSCPFGQKCRYRHPDGNVQDHTPKNH